MSRPAQTGYSSKRDAAIRKSGGIFHWRGQGVIHAKMLVFLFPVFP
jgi:hypothetical protein